MIYKIKYFFWLLFYGDTREKFVPKGFISWLEKQPNKDEIIRDLYGRKESINNPHRSRKIFINEKRGL